MPPKSKTAQSVAAPSVAADTTAAVVASAAGAAPVSGTGRTRQQQEDAELRQLQEMAATLFQTVQQPRGAKAGGKSKKAAAQRHKQDENLQQRRAVAERDLEMAHTRLWEASIYQNQYVKLSEGITWFNVGKNKWIRYEQFKPEYLERVVHLLTISLSEPYNAFTYKYFLSGWPDLGICVFGVEADSEPSADVQGELIGAVVSKVSRKQPAKPLRGYIAMLAVAESFRGFRLGQRLVTVTVELMKQKKVDEVCLETPISNDRALQLYLSLGFVKHKFLTRYYLDGQDAVRLKLWLTSPYDQPDMPDTLKLALETFQRAANHVRLLEAQDPTQAQLE
jgi:peptide alpha-N-acetyltransferase